MPRGFRPAAFGHHWDHYVSTAGLKADAPTIRLDVGSIFSLLSPPGATRLSVDFRFGALAMRGLGACHAEGEASGIDLILATASMMSSFGSYHDYAAFDKRHCLIAAGFTAKMISFREAP